MSLPLAAGDWPNFMGPNFNHVSDETDLLIKWPEKGPKTLWQAEIGIGYSGVSVAEGRAVTIGWQDGKETVWCFDAEKGNLIWKHTYPAKKLDLFHPGGPNAAPTLHEGRVYTLSKDGQVFCFSADKGKILWQASLMERMGLEKMTRWGFSSAPLIDGDALIFHSNRLLALDRKTGSLLWKSEKSELPGYCTPAIFEYKGEKRIASLSGDSLLIFDGKGGHLLRHPFKIQYNTHCVSPMVTEGGSAIFISASNQDGRCEKLAFDGSSLKKTWGNKEMRNFMNNSILLDGYLYGVDGKHKKPRITRLVCMRWSDGKPMWSQAGLGCGSLIAAGKTLIILSEEGELLSVSATQEKFSPISRAQMLPGTCWTPPSLARGLLYIRNDKGALRCLSLRK